MNYPLMYYDNRFYNIDGEVSEDKLIDNNGDFVDWLYRVSDTYHPEWIGVDPFEFVK